MGKSLYVYPSLISKRNPLVFWYNKYRWFSCNYEPQPLNKVMACSHTVVYQYLFKLPLPLTGLQFLTTLILEIHFTFWKILFLNFLKVFSNWYPFNMEFEGFWMILDRYFELSISELKWLIFLVQNDSSIIQKLFSMSLSSYL